MTFEEWFHKEYEPADLQLKQYAERNEGLHIPVALYLEDLKKAFEAGFKADVHTDNSKVIAELEAQIEKMKNKNKESDAVLAAGSTFNKALNSMNKALEEERDKYRNMVFDKDEQLTKAKNILRYVLNSFVGDLPRNLGYFDEEELKAIAETEQFLKDLEK